MYKIIHLSLFALQKYRPKFASILCDVSEEANIGRHLLYTNFKTIEGVGILRLISLQNGFEELKLKKENWVLDTAMISKWTGGIGLHIHDIRATGSVINGTNGTSNT